MDELDPDGLVQLGSQLRRAGLTPRTVAAWAGTARLAALPARIETRIEARTPTGALLALLLAGAEVSPDQLRPRGAATSSAAAPSPALPTPSSMATSVDALIAALVAHGLIEHGADRLRARVAIVPLGQALLVCDRLDAPIERDLVCWPDDSSHHLASAIPPGRRARWLDLGCGSAVAPLARPELASEITGIDINPRAVRYARLGAALSGISHLAATLGDAGDDHGTADLVTCNAPIPPACDAPLGTPIPEIWRHAEPALFARLWLALRRAVRPGGTIVVHAACDAMLPALRDTDGERAIVRYTPPCVRGFAVAWWRPDAPDRFTAVDRGLSLARPHVDPRDRDDALARGAAGAATATGCNASEDPS